MRADMQMELYCLFLRTRSHQETLYKMTDRLVSNQLQKQIQQSSRSIYKYILKPSESNSDLRFCTFTGSRLMRLTVEISSCI